MHQYLETVRNEIEVASANESYLASTFFLRMYNEFAYEDEGAWKIAKKEDYESVQHRAVNSISKQRDFNLKEEILAWQIAMLRDIAKESYNWWIAYKDEKLRAADHFSDGESCMALEATCEKLDVNPTDAYTALLEIEFILTRLCTSCNKSVIELDRYWQFKYHNKKKAPENSFVYKRIEAESKQQIVYKSIETLSEVSRRCSSYARQLAGANHLLWMHPHYFLESVIHMLRGFLNFEYIEEADVSLSKWLDELFPKRLPSGQPNPGYQSGLHQKIMVNLTQATQCMVQQTVKRKDVFNQRDEILRPYFYEALEKVKRVGLENLGQLKEENKNEHQHQHQQLN